MRNLASHFYMCTLYMLPLQGFLVCFCFSEIQLVYTVHFNSNSEIVTALCTISEKHLTCTEFYSVCL